MRCTKFAVATLLVVCALGHVNYAQAQLGDDDEKHMSSESGVPPGTENAGNTNPDNSDHSDHSDNSEIEGILFDDVNSDTPDNDHKPENIPADNSQKDDLPETGNIVSDSPNPTGNPTAPATTSPEAPTKPTQPASSPTDTSSSSTVNSNSSSSKMSSTTASHKASSSVGLEEDENNEASALMGRTSIQVLAFSMVVSVPLTMLL